MTSANGIGIEVFASMEPPQSHGVLEERSIHICITEPDIDGLVARIIATGGRQLSKIWQDRVDQPTYRMAYCTDPFNNVIEIATHSYELMQDDPTKFGKPHEAANRSTSQTTS